MSGVDVLFAERVEELARDQPGTVNEWWWHRLVFEKAGNRCAYCHTPLASRQDKANPGPGRKACIDHLISRYHAGPQVNDNLVPSCYSCNLHKGSSDLLAWKGFTGLDFEGKPNDLAARRLRMMALSPNHLLRNPNLGKKKETVLRHLGTRWQHPRAVAWAAMTTEGGFIRFWGPNRVPEQLTAVMLKHKAVRIQRHYWRFPAYPDPAFHDAVWQLIDLNAWVRRIDLGEAHADPTPDSSGDGQWHLTYSNVLDIRRRRPKLKPKWLPPEERPMDWGRRLLIEYDASWKTRRPFDWDWVNKHRETDLAFERARDAKREENEKLLKALDARMALDQQEAEARRIQALPLIDQLWLELDRRARDPNSGSAWDDFVRKHGAAPTA